ncbi:hypothetical protein G3576_15335 [Roseomonas stagni]|uniref:Uncharacterized protein n=1 Tax=Falsiroseomonas algicola TaxID=2716930 RepID=A0A6M1LM27_9PROT|nr:hypothetical protein [Falsiroseomonas algicola]NGM21396.1 hypothetical protein [Falsiroseomonas algicola]
MQPTERIDQAAAAPPRSASGAGVFLAHAAALLLRAIAIVILAAPVVIGLVLLAR